MVNMLAARRASSGLNGVMGRAGSCSDKRRHTEWLPIVPCLRLQASIIPHQNAPLDFAFLGVVGDEQPSPIHTYSMHGLFM
jgi:hypothetical protein